MVATMVTSASKSYPERQEMTGFKLDKTGDREMRPALL